VAAQEIEEISDWYGERSLRARERFLDELDAALDRILEAPKRWQAHLHGTRRALLRKFPFGVVYRLDEPWVEIVAVAHHKRRPGYWSDR